MLGSIGEILPNEIKLNANKDENWNFKSDQLNVDDNDLKDKITPNKKKSTAVKLKETTIESESILPENINKADYNFSNADKIKNILNRAKIIQTNSDKNLNLNSPVKDILTSTTPRTPKREQVFNMIELGNQAELMINNNYESPNMIKDSFRINSNTKNQPKSIEFLQEKNISNTTFRAGSEVNKNK